MSASPVTELLELLRQKEVSPDGIAGNDLFEQTDMNGYEMPDVVLKAIPHYQKVVDFRNHNGRIFTASVILFKPVSIDQVLFLANDAAARGFGLRPLSNHSDDWVVVYSNDSAADLKTQYLTDTANLREMTFQFDKDTPTATFGTGVTLMEALDFLQMQTEFECKDGYTLGSITSNGRRSIGEMLATGDHGIGVYSHTGAGTKPGGSICNMVRSFKAIVTEPQGDGIYRVKHFDRDAVDASAFLTHLGCAFIVEVTLQVEPNYYLEQANWHPRANDLFEPAGLEQSANALQTIVDAYEGVKVTYIPYTSYAWVRTWKQVIGSTLNNVAGPAINRATKFVSRETNNAIQNLFIKARPLTPILLHAFLDQSRLSAAGRPCVVASGLSKDMLLYSDAYQLRTISVGYAVQIRHKDIQKAVHAFYTRFNELLKIYKINHNQYPVNGPIDFFFTSLNDPTRLNISGAAAPLLAPSTPVYPEKPEVDTTLWINIQTLPGTAGASSFFEEMETWIDSTWPGAVRPDWSKGWGFTMEVAGNGMVVKTRLRRYYGNTLRKAKNIFKSYDHHSIYFNPLLNKIVS
jgi:hypothetical protein